jgi:hypothetical protein
MSISTVFARDTAIVAAINSACQNGKIQPKYAAKLISEVRVIRERCCESNVDLATYIVDIAQSGRATRLLDNIHREWDNVSTRNEKIKKIYTFLTHDKNLGDEAVRKFWYDLKSASITATNTLTADNVLTDKIATSMPSLTTLYDASKRVLATIGPRSVSNKTLNAYQEGLWLLIAALVPAKRDDWGHVHVVHGGDGSVHDRSGDSYILVPEKGLVRLTLKHYKTDKTYGSFTEEMPTEVDKAMRASLKRFPRDHLFVNVDRDSLCGEGAFARFASRVMTKHHHDGGIKTLNGLRKAWAQTVANGNEQAGSNANKAALARSMLHSVSEQQKHYTHYVATTDPEEDSFATADGQQYLLNAVDGDRIADSVVGSQMPRRAPFAGTASRTGNLVESQ